MGVVPILGIIRKSMRESESESGNVNNPYQRMEFLNKPFEDNVTFAFASAQCKCTSKRVMNCKGSCRLLKTNYSSADQFWEETSEINVYWLPWLGWLVSKININCNAQSDIQWKVHKVQNPYEILNLIPRKKECLGKRISFVSLSSRCLFRISDSHLV